MSVVIVCSLLQKLRQRIEESVTFRNLTEIRLRADLPVLIEHLNMLMVGNADDFTMVEESIFRKHANHTPKAVLLLGNPSLLLKEAIRAHWGDIPLILCAEDDFYGPPQAYIEKKSIACEQRVPLSTLSDEYNLTVLHAKMFLKDNVDLLRHLLPRLKEVILIGDDRYVNQQLDCDMTVIPY